MPPAQPAGPSPTVEQQVSGWIQNNQTAIAHTTDVLLAYTHPNLAAAAADPDRFHQPAAYSATNHRRRERSDAPSGCV